MSFPSCFSVLLSGKEPVPLCFPGGTCPWFALDVHSGLVHLRQALALNSFLKLFPTVSGASTTPPQALCWFLRTHGTCHLDLPFDRACLNSSCLLLWRHGKQFMQIIAYATDCSQETPGPSSGLDLSNTNSDSHQV